MEYLETKGVPVIGYQTDELPAFFTRQSGIKLNSFSETPDNIAHICKVKNDLNIEGGVVIANPVLKNMNYLNHILTVLLKKQLKKQKRKVLVEKILRHFYLVKLSKNLKVRV